MSKFLFILILSIGKLYGQQPSKSDTLCFDLPTVRRLVSNSEQGKLLKQQVTVMNERIALLQSMVTNLETKDSITVATYTKEIKELAEKETIYKDQIKVFEKLLKREKLKRKLTAASGIVTTGLAIFLSLKK